MALVPRNSKILGKSLFSSSFLNPRGSQVSNSSFSGYEDEDNLGESLEALIRILKRPSNQRNLKNLQMLIGFARYIKFFQQGSVEVSEETITQCCIYMTYEFYNKGEYVFRQGEQGSKFYILLEGACTVILNDHGKPVPTPVNHISRGDSFGEMALIQNKPRAASIICVQDSHFAVLEKEDYTRILAKVHEIAINKKAEFLHSLPMFVSCTRSSVQKLLFYFHERFYQRKQVLYKSGDPAESVFFIREGEIQILQDVRLQTHTAASKIHKFQVTKAQIAILGKGECFGCEEVLDNGAYQYTSVCHSQAAMVFALSKDDFLKRVALDETLKAIRELTLIKDQLRKDQIMNGRTVRESPEYHQVDSTRSSLMRLVKKPGLTERGREVSPMGSPRKGSETGRGDRGETGGEGGEGLGAIGSFELRESYKHLYPFQDKIREGGFHISPTSELGIESTNNIRRLKSWALIFARKKAMNRSRDGAIAKSREHKVVNIHTYNQRMQETKHLTESSLRISLTSRSTSKQSPRPLNKSQEFRTSACLAINSVEVLPRDSDESKTVSPRFDRFVRTPHSQFRLKKVLPLVGGEMG